MNEVECVMASLMCSELPILCYSEDIAVAHEHYLQNNVMLQSMGILHINKGYFHAFEAGMTCIQKHRHIKSYVFSARNR